MCEAYYDSRAHDLVKAIERFVDANIEADTELRLSLQSTPETTKQLSEARDNLVREISKILKDRS